MHGLKRFGAEVFREFDGRIVLVRRQLNPGVAIAALELAEPNVGLAMSAGSKARTCLRNPNVGASSRRLLLRLRDDYVPGALARSGRCERPGQFFDSGKQLIMDR
jgi:hypothetical protein